MRDRFDKFKTTPGVDESIQTKLYLVIYIVLVKKPSLHWKCDLLWKKDTKFNKIMLSYTINTGISYTIEDEVLKELNMIE